MTYKIRRMEEDDIPYVQEVAKVSWNDTYDGIIPTDIQNKFLQSAYSKTTLAWRLKQSNLWVAEDEEKGKIVGFANFSPLKDHGEVELGAIYLLPLYQGKGIGTALLETGKTEIKGLKRIVLSVEKSNRKGFQFYESKGFQVESEYDDNFEGHVFKTVRLVLDT